MTGSSISRAAPGTSTRSQEESIGRLCYTRSAMATKASTQRIETEVPAQLFAEMQSLVESGWFRSVDEVVLDAVRRFLDAHREELMEAFLREDVEWGLRGRD